MTTEHSDSNSDEWTKVEDPSDTESLSSANGLNQKMASFCLADVHAKRAAQGWYWGAPELDEKERSKAFREAFKQNDEPKPSKPNLTLETKKPDSNGEPLIPVKTPAVKSSEVSQPELLVKKVPIPSEFYELVENKDKVRCNNCHCETLERYIGDYHAEQRKIDFQRFNRPVNDLREDNDSGFCLKKIEHYGYDPNRLDRNYYGIFGRKGCYDNSERNRGAYHHGDNRLGSHGESRREVDICNFYNFPRNRNASFGVNRQDRGGSKRRLTDQEWKDERLEFLDKQLAVNDYKNNRKDCRGNPSHFMDRFLHFKRDDDFYERHNRINEHHRYPSFQRSDIEHQSQERKYQRYQQEKDNGHGTRPYDKGNHYQHHGHQRPNWEHLHHFGQRYQPEEHQCPWENYEINQRGQKLYNDRYEQRNQCHGQGTSRNYGNEERDYSNRFFYDHQDDRCWQPRLHYPKIQINNGLYEAVVIRFSKILKAIQLEPRTKLHRIVDIIFESIELQNDVGRARFDNYSIDLSIKRVLSYRKSDGEQRYVEEILKAIEEATCQDFKDRTLVIAIHEILLATDAYTYLNRKKEESKSKKEPNQQ